MSEFQKYIDSYSVLYFLSITAQYTSPDISFIKQSATDDETMSIAVERDSISIVPITREANQTRKEAINDSSAAP